MHCSNNHGQQNFPGLNQEHEHHGYLIEEIRERLLKLERSTGQLRLYGSRPMQGFSETNWLINWPKQRRGTKI